MFDPIKHPNTTRTLGKPVNWDDATMGTCVGLPVVESEGVFYSYWRVPLRTRFWLLFGGWIRLAVFSNAHPPVAIDATRN